MSKTSTLKCFECDSVFTRAEHLNRHLDLKHSGTTLDSWPCVDCGVDFKLKQHLVRHSKSRKHRATTGELPATYPCGVCSKRYQSRSRLETHVKKHTKSLVCAQCLLDIRPRQAAVAEKNYCVCSAKASPKERACPLCPRVLSCTSSLNAHLKTHDTNRKDNFPCHHPGCYRLFSSLKTRAFHIKTKHAADKSCVTKYLCGVCSMEFLYKTTRDRHLAKIHSSPADTPATPESDDQSLVVVADQSVESDDVTMVSGAECDDESSAAKDPGEANLAELLTGFNHPRSLASDRPIACHAANCQVRFKRLYDLKRHWNSQHQN
ncbi:hypothetical protein HDV03_003583 [Kappamyces sp. JEL0829]|nr:hypothetical protein HDV03_003583 [Kappamyces sp. JEL0829]